MKGNARPKNLLLFVCSLVLKAFIFEWAAEWTFFMETSPLSESCITLKKLLEEKSIDYLLMQLLSPKFSICSVPSRFYPESGVLGKCKLMQQCSSLSCCLDWSWHFILKSLQNTPKFCSWWPTAYKLLQNLISSLKILTPVKIKHGFCLKKKNCFWRSCFLRYYLLQQSGRRLRPNRKNIQQTDPGVMSRDELCPGHGSDFQLAPLSPPQFSVLSTERPSSSGLKLHCSSDIYTQPHQRKQWTSSYSKCCSAKSCLGTQRDWL